MNGFFTCLEPAGINVSLGLTITVKYEIPVALPAMLFAVHSYRPAFRVTRCSFSKIAKNCQKSQKWPKNVLKYQK